VQNNSWFRFQVSLNVWFCADVNECTSSKNNTCQYGGHCVNKPGGFICICPSNLTSHVCNQSKWLDDFTILCYFQIAAAALASNANILLMRSQISTFCGLIMKKILFSLHHLFRKITRRSSF